MVDLLTEYFRSVRTSSAGKSAYGSGSLLAGIGSVAFSTGLSLGARTLLSQLQENRTPSIYQFDQPQPEVSGVKPVPIVFGRVRVSGNVLETDERGRDRYINTVYGLSEGPISDVFDIRALNTPPKSNSEDFVVRGPKAFLGEANNGFRTWGAEALEAQDDTKYFLEPEQDYPFTALVWVHLRATLESTAGLIPPLSWTIDGYRCRRIYDDPSDAGNYGHIQIGDHNRFLDFYDSDLGEDGYLSASITPGVYHLTTYATSSGGIAHAIQDGLNSVTGASNEWEVIYSTPTASDQTRLIVQRSSSGHGTFQLLTHTGLNQPAGIWNDVGWTEHNRRLELTHNGGFSQKFTGPDVQAENIATDSVYRITADHPYMSTFSRNPARILYTLLCDSRIGAGVEGDEIDRTSFERAEARADELVDDDDSSRVRLGQNIALPGRAEVLTNCWLFEEGGFFEIRELNRWNRQAIKAANLLDLIDNYEGCLYLDLSESVENPYVAIVFQDESGYIKPTTIGAVELAFPEYTQVGSLEYSTVLDPDPENDEDWNAIDYDGELRGRIDFDAIESVTGIRLAGFLTTQTVRVIDHKKYPGGANIPVGKMVLVQVIQASNHRPPRYCLDIVLDQTMPLGRHLEEILATFCGALIEQDGQISLRLFEDGPIQQHFDEDDILHGTFSYEYPSLRDTPNRFIVVFRDAENLYYPTAVTVDDELRQREERRIRAGVVRLSGITRRVQAELIASYITRAARYQLQSCRFRVPAQGFRRCPMDLISVTYAPAGYARRPFRIVSIRPDDTQHVILECLEHVRALDRERFQKRSLHRAAEGTEPGLFIVDPGDLILEDSAKSFWSQQLTTWNGTMHQWYRPELATQVTAITLPTVSGSCALMVQAGNALLRRMTDASDTTGEWSLTGNRLQFHGMSVGPDDDVRIAYV